MTQSVWSCMLWTTLLALSLGSAGQALAQDAAADTGAGPFAAGSWTVQSYGSAAIGDWDKGEMYSLHLGVGYYFEDNKSINLEAFGARVDSNVDDDGYGAGLDLLFRWHFLAREQWSLYLDAGAGIQQTTTNYPSDNHFNFRPQVGLGFTYEIMNDCRLMGGIRYLHISNASITDGNDGFDGAMPYLGLIVGF